MRPIWEFSPAISGGKACYRLLKVISEAPFQGPDIYQRVCEMLNMSRISFDWLERRNELSPHKEALVDISSGRSLTYRQLHERANKLANGWRSEWKVKKGDRIAILAHNCPEYLEALFAVAKIGAILVPVNIRLAGPELVYILNDCEPKGFILGEDFLDVISRIKSEIKIDNYLLLDRAQNEGMTPYEAFLNGADAQTPRLEEPNSLDDAQVILYTSGTTGYPKGSIQTHGNILFNSLNANIALDLVSTDVTVCGLPLFHTGGLHVMTTPTLYAGGTVLILRTFDAGEALRLIHEKKVNTVFFVSTMWLFMCQHKDFEKTDFSGLRLTWSGGAPCPIPVIEAYSKKGVFLGQGYGLTEVGPDSTMLTAEDAIRKAGSVGKATFHTAMRAINENGTETAVREVGEMVFRGPTVTKGYWNNPQATDEAMRDGWFHTGDLGYRDEDGYYFLVDRMKDMFISGGENVYPAQVEKVIYEHPGVAEVAVFGIPDKKWGEVGHAVICKKSGSTLTEEELVAFLQNKLARFKIPKTYSFTESLPRNPSGKILKRVLREPYWKELKEQVH